ncbi:macrolide family glycosyltransferase [Paenibacillus physcomitrellae]|uniref:Glycosyl transferase family 1 n=1 Tax=Paenibacillus physcomitrellae TaxID=1619311 RepID=A0ABQ1G008_9BACL|nr:macrolide family glycosyltransferase [Paenibacillus physcomitrellae]GGA34170.1 glycosyl transferase family 1 [Paenibacillus physcomitrellae]
MARVLWINGGSEGHIQPTLGVVRELIGRGEEVVYFVSDSFRGLVESTGAKVITFGGQAFVEAFLAGGRSPWGRVSGLLRTADIVIPGVLEQIQGERFDYMIHDSMFGCGRLLAQILKLPAISSCTSFALGPEEFEQMQDQLSSRFPAEVNEQAWQELLRLVNDLEAKYEVKAGSAYDIFCNPAPLTLVYTSRSLQPGGELFDDTYKFVGPSITPRPHEPFELSSIDTDHLIYISLGTVFNQALDFYKLCLSAFAGTNHTVILSVGRQTQVAELGDLPANFIVRPYVPQLEVLQHAKLFITHGGMNSTHEGLYYAVPMIVLPQSADQPAIARRVAELGAGIHLNQDHLTAEALRDAAEHVLGDAAIRRNSAKLGDSLRAAGGVERAADEIFTYKRSLRLNN